MTNSSVSEWNSMHCAIPGGEYPCENILPRARKGDHIDRILQNEILQRLSQAHTRIGEPVLDL
jgi:hypothetical protein